MRVPRILNKHVLSGTGALSDYSGERCNRGVLTVFLLMNIVFQSYIHVTMANSSDEWYTTDSDAVTDSDSEDGSTSSAFVPPALSHEPCYIVKTLIEHVEAMVTMLEVRLLRQQTREGLAYDKIISVFWNLPKFIP
jgi:hypothetical protein